MHITLNIVDISARAALTRLGRRSREKLLAAIYAQTQVYTLEL